VNSTSSPFAVPGVVRVQGAKRHQRRSHGAPRLLDPVPVLQLRWGARTDDVVVGPTEAPELFFDPLGSGGSGGNGGSGASVCSALSNGSGGVGGGRRPAVALRRKEFIKLHPMQPSNWGGER